MKKIAWFFLWSLLILGSFGDCFAFTYTEAVDGDLDYQNIGDLSLGLNTISGTAFDDAEGPNFNNPIFDQDAFQFNIPSGMQLTELKLEWNTNYTSNEGIDSARWIYVIHVLPDYIWQYDFSTSILGAGSNGDIIVPAIGAGTYEMGQGFGLTTGDKFTTSYTLSLTTVATPIPSTLSLFGIGLFSLVGISRRKK